MEVDDTEYLRHTNAMLVRENAQLKEVTLELCKKLAYIVRMDRRIRWDLEEYDGPAGMVAKEALEASARSLGSHVYD